ncbi:MAG: ABC transporter ATP-binding protein, partial [Deltaproteobacteria bacterium]
MKVVVRELGKIYRSFGRTVRALSGVNASIEEGEFFVLLGPSGCGKTTFLNLLAGLEKPTEGEIWFDTDLVASARKNFSLPPQKRNVAMVFQSYALYPHMTVFENISFPLKMRKTAKQEIRETVTKVAESLGISHLLEAKPRELSGGEKQRVAIARALVRRPNLFLLDEPLSSLDAKLRASTRTELKTIQRKFGVTTVYVTHDQVEAMSLGDRIGVMREGKIEQVGTPEEIYDHPANPFVASFIGNPPMNLIAGEIIRESGRYQFVSEDIKVDIPPEVLEASKIQEPGSVILGFRPETVTLSHPGEGKECINAEVVVVETLGKEKVVHLRVG